MKRILSIIMAFMLVAGISEARRFGDIDVYGTSTLRGRVTIGGADADDYTLPIDDGAADQCMITNGSGAVSFQACGVGGGDSVTVAGAAIDTTADFVDDGDIDFTLTDGGAGGPDAIKADVKNDVIGPANFIPSTDFGDVNTDAGGALRYGGDSVDDSHLNWGSMTYLGEEGESLVTAYPAVGTFESGDTFICYEAGEGARECDYDDLPAAVGLLLNEVGDPDGDTSFTMGNNEIKFLFGGNDDDHNFELDVTGNSTGDVLHVHQHTGNPTGGNIAHFESTDPDITPMVYIFQTDSTLGAAVTGLLIESADDDDANWNPFILADNGGDFFFIDHLGSIEIGTIPAGSVVGLETAVEAVVDHDDLQNVDAGEHISWEDAGPAGTIHTDNYFENVVDTLDATCDAGNVTDQNIVLDKGANHSPLIRFIEGGDDKAEIFMDDQSNMLFVLSGEDGDEFHFTWKDRGGEAGADGYTTSLVIEMETETDNAIHPTFEIRSIWTDATATTEDAIVEFHTSVDSIMTKSITLTGANVDMVGILTVAGRVGVGTATPAASAKLHVDGGDIFIIDNGNNPRLVLGDTTGAGRYGSINWNSAGDYLHIGTEEGGENVLILAENGNVGIGGDTTPDYLLDVQGTLEGETITEDGNAVYNSTEAATFASVNKVTITAPAAGSTLTIEEGFTLTVDGNATVQGTNTGDNDEVGVLTNGKWCTTDGSVINCEENEPAGGNGGGFAWQLEPKSAKLPASNPMGIDAGNLQWRGLFDDTTDECARWQGILTPYGGGGLDIDIVYTLETGSSSDVVELEVHVMCGKNNADVDTDSFDTVNNLSSGSVSTTAGYQAKLTATLSNDDSCAEDDLIIIKICRDADDTDTTADDVEFRGASVHE